jgi:very-short-patch-repair endonuclease
MRKAARDSRRDPTESQEILWEALRSGRLAGVTFRRQHPVGEFVLDFFCREAQLAIEIDEPMDRKQERAADERQRDIEDLGIRVLRLPRTLVDTNVSEALFAIEAALGESEASA